MRRPMLCPFETLLGVPWQPADPGRPVRPVFRAALRALGVLRSVDQRGAELLLAVLDEREWNRLASWKQLLVLARLGRLDVTMSKDDAYEVIAEAFASQKDAARGHDA